MQQWQQQPWQQPNPYQPPAMQPWGQQHAAVGCESCGRHAPTKNVYIMENIGLLVLRFDRSVRGNFCKRCIGHHVWRSQLVNVFVGWWGVISFFFTAVAIPVNFFTWLSSRGMADEFPSGGY
ncbi:MAG TPA: hypothetical protein VFB62_12385 [Polyangiaceae bacterium]|jgi:hypothetical protein|nr:hypothetical protein [Polyangiaceae bacterium]